MKYQAVIFDMDGTVLDTAQDIVDSVNATLERWGRATRDFATIVANTGNGARVLVAKCLEKGYDDPDFEALSEDYRQYYSAHALIKTKPYDGVVDVLRALQRQGVAVAIVSNKPHEAVQELAQRFFTGIPAFGERPGIPAKPNPDMVRNAMRELGVEGVSAVYVGDSEVDVATARNSALPLVAVSWGFRPRSELEKDGAEIIVDTMDELLTALS